MRTVRIIQSIDENAAMMPGGRGLNTQKQTMVHRRKLLNCLVALVIGCADVVSASRHPFLRTQTVTLSPASKLSLQVRGGAGPIPPTAVAKTMTAAAIGIGFFCNEAPKASLEYYGSNDTSFSVQLGQRLMGAAILNIGIVGICLFVLHTTVHEAIGWSHIVWIVENAKAIMNRWESSVGVTPMGRWLWLGISIVMLHACLTNASYANLLVQISYTLDGIGALNAIFNPKIFAAYIFGNQDPSREALVWTRAYGYETLAMAVLMVALASGVDKQVAFGYMSMPVIPHMISALFLSKEGQKNAFVAMNYVGPLVLHIANFITLAIPSKLQVE